MKDLTSQYETIIKERIINGDYRIGEKIPPLRDLATELNCSRSVINVVIARLAAQGYLFIQKRQKTVVSDFMTTGSLNIIQDIIFGKNKDLKYQASKSVLAARKLIEVESVKQACIICNEDEIVMLEKIINAELKLIEEGVTNFSVIAENDFSFHNQIIRMSGNVLYRIIMNSIKDVALNMTKYFYESKSNFFGKYVACHQQILQAVKNKDQDEAAAVLTEILEHGEKLYIDLF